MKIPNIIESCKKDYLEGRRTIEEIALTAYNGGHFNYIPNEKETFEWMFGKVNPYYRRKIEKRLDIIKILKLAKENGCEVYITPAESNYDYGYIFFPDDVIMYIQNGDFWGWDFSIQYIPSRETGTGCRCNEESITSIDWDGLLKQKAEGLKFAQKLKARLYKSADEFKRNRWNFDDMVQI